MAHGTRLATMEAADLNTSAIRNEGKRPRPRRNAQRRTPGFGSFAETLRRDLAPSSRLEEVLVDRVVFAAWRLERASGDDRNGLLEAGVLPAISREILRAERSLETSLELLETARSACRQRWGRSLPAPASVASFVDASEDDFESSYLSNEWTIVPEERLVSPSNDEPEGDDEETEPVVRWQDRLVFDDNVSETSPVVKGTWVTVSHVVSLIVDGCTWSDILRSHPELNEDDIRTCLAYTIEQDNQGSV